MRLERNLEIKCHLGKVNKPTKRPKEYWHLRGFCKIQIWNVMTCTNCVKFGIKQTYLKHTRTHSLGVLNTHLQNFNPCYIVNKIISHGLKDSIRFSSSPPCWDRILIPSSLLLCIHTEGSSSLFEMTISKCVTLWKSLRSSLRITLLTEFLTSQVPSLNYSAEYCLD